MSPLSLGIDPSTNGYYWAIVQGQPSGRFDVLDCGRVDRVSVAAICEQLSAADVERVTVEDLAAWVDKAEKFFHLTKTAEVIGMLRAACETLGIEMERVDQRTWRKALGVGGKQQDAQVANYLALVIGKRPKKGWNNHTRDATGVAIYAASALLQYEKARQGR